MANFKNFVINNRGTEPVSFKFSQFATEFEEQRERASLVQTIDEDEEKERSRFLTDVSTDSRLKDKISILTRSFQNRRTVIENDELIFEDSIIEVEPSQGQIHPGRSVEISVIYRPEKIGNFERTFFCDVQGRENRLPLVVKGFGQGPKLDFNYDSVDIGKCFVTSHHTYEIVLRNRGEIDGIFTFIPSKTAFGSMFNFTPTEGIVMPGGYQLIEVAFSAKQLGAFQEDFEFSIDGTDKNLKISIRGEVIGPTFRFEPSTVDFGTVSLGFAESKSCKIMNTSLVPMEFELELLDSQLDQALLEMSPSRGRLEPESETEIKLTFKANLESTYNVTIAVNIPGVGKSILQVPVSATSKVPDIQLNPSSIDLNRIFLDYVVSDKVVLFNTSNNLRAVYSLKSLEDNDQISVDFESPSGIIEPQQTLNIPIQIKANKLNQIENAVQLFVEGRNQVISQCAIAAHGEGPVVTATPTELNWGVVPVLQKFSKTIKLKNQSLIPARYSVSFEKENSVWKVSSDKGVIAPNQMAEMEVFVEVDDSIHFEDKLIVTVDNGNRIVIDVSCDGIGCTVVTEPPMNPVPGGGLDLGPLFATQEVKKVFKLINRGKRHQQVHWSVAGFEKASQRSIAESRKYKEILKSKDVKYQGLKPPPPPKMSTFKITPYRLELKPNEEAFVTLEGYAEDPGPVQETLVCHAIIGKNLSKERIMQVPIKCQFITPLVKTSTESIHFEVNKDVNHKLALQKKEFAIENSSSLPLNMTLRMEDSQTPFSIFEDGIKSQKLSVPSGKTVIVPVYFEPAYQDDFVSREALQNIVIEFADHPSTRVVQLSGRVNFPNLEFSQSDVDFGTSLCDIEMSTQITIKNNGPLAANYKWWFEVDEETSGISFDPPAVSAKQSRSSLPVFKSEKTSKTSLTFKSIQSNFASDTQLEQLSDIAEVQESNASVQSVHGDKTIESMSFLDENHKLGIEEVFDLLPLYGRLEPGESVQTTITFYGHPYVKAECRAICDVEGGPEYELNLAGQAANMEFEFVDPSTRKSHITASLTNSEVNISATEIRMALDRVAFDRITEREILLRNTGNVGFDFSMDDCVRPSTEAIEPGQVAVYPSKCHVPAESEQILKISFLPGAPEEFHKRFQIHIAHFRPIEVILMGIGVFPRILLDQQRLDTGSEADFRHVVEAVRNQSRRDGDEYSMLSESEAILEAERIIMAEVTKKVPSDQVLRVNHKSKYQLPDYVIDFGHVIIGEIKEMIINITNPESIPVSFTFDHSLLFQTGFFCELDRVKLLPQDQTVGFKFVFDPRGALLDIGPAETVVPINIVDGPTINLIVKAHVTMPSLEIQPTSQIDFGSVECGKCKVWTIQLHNPLDVAAEWSYHRPVDKRLEVDKHMPMHLRRKLRKQQKPSPMVFDIMPSQGRLEPHGRENIQIRFLPSDGENYRQTLILMVADSTKRLTIDVSGTGEAPRIELSQNMVELGPILPFSDGATMDFTISNPCDFKVEVYSLDFDRQYLEEEEILRNQSGYDQYNNLLLPPRQAGDTLPEELLPKKPETPIEDPAQVKSHVDVPDEAEKQPLISEPGDPVSASIARHLGIDDSPEGRAARKRLGLSVVIWGPPMSGKSCLAREISRNYTAVMLTIDEVLMEAILNSNSDAAKKARELCQAETKLKNAEMNPGIVGEPTDDGVFKDSDSQPRQTSTAASQPSSKEASSKKDNKSSMQRRSDTKAGGRSTGQTDMIPRATPLLPQTTIGGPHRIGSASASNTGDPSDPIYTCVLPEDLVAEILSERLELDDCYRGVVWDGLESCFLSTITQAAQAVLKALNNRKYIYMIHTKLTMAEYEDRVRKTELQKLQAAEKARADFEKKIAEMSEDEYDRLDDKEKEKIDQCRLEKKRERREKKKRELEEQLREQESLVSADLGKSKKKGKKEELGKQRSGMISICFNAEPLRI